jgi:type I restriction enzyme S subunit
MMSEGLTLPLGWCCTSLEKIATWGSGGTPSRNIERYFQGTIPWIKTGELGSMYIRDATEHITEEALNNSSAKIFPKGSVGIAMYGATIGKLSIWGMDASTNQACAVGVPTEAISNEFLYYFLLAEKQKLIKAGKGGAQPNISQSIVKEWPINLPPFPEQHRIVAKIEELFSELDKGIENLKTAQSQLKVYRQALLKHAFEGKLTAQWRAERHAKQSVAPAKAGAQPLNDMDSRLPPAFARVTGNDKPLESADTLLKRIQQERAQRYQQQLADWEASGKHGSKPKPPKTLPPLTAEELAELPELPEGWGWVTLAHIQSHDKYAVKAGPFGSALKKEFYVQDGYKIYGQEQVIRSDHEYGDYFVDERKFDELASCAVKPSDVLISLVGTIGKVLVLPETAKPGIINPRLVKISLNLHCYRANFFKAYFESGFLRSLYANESQGTTMDILNLGMIQRLPYPLCSVIEQDKILEILEEKFSEVDQLDQTITTALQQAEALRQSILKKAFSGQLVPQDPNDEPASELLARIRAERDAPSAKPKLTNTTRKSL